MGADTYPDTYVLSRSHVEARYTEGRDVPLLRHRGLGQAVAESIGRRSRTGDRAADADLVVDVGDMPLDRADAQDEFPGDLVIAFACHHQTQDLQLAWSQIRPGRRCTVVCT